MMTKRILLIPALVCLITTGTAAQVLDDIQNKFTRYNQNTYQEKLFAHTDKSFYLAGEVLWFKLYNVSEAHNKLVSASKVAYVEVLDKDNNPIMQAKVELNEATGNGSFYIPVSANSGNYKLRAYTNWMKNFSAERYFEKAITIVNSLKEITLQNAQPVAANYDIQFFPEGGTLINNLNNNVAYRVVGTDGKGVEFSGAIINQRNDTITRFKPYKFGIGTFNLKPGDGNTYTAVLKINGKTITKPLPQPTALGYAMQLSDDAEQIKIAVKSTINTTGAIYLVIHNRQTLTGAKTLNLINGEGSFLVDKKSLHEGVSHFTLFNSDKQPVGERLYMVRPTQKLAIEATADMPIYASRKNVSVAIQTKDNSNPEAADLSMAVYRLDSLETSSPESIHTYIWLTSELKGSIESPEYYLSTNDNEALDNLMLTHGWSKYKWDEVLQAKTPVFKYMPEFDGHIITGKITDPVSNAGVKNRLVNLGVPGRRVQLYYSQSDADGNFTMSTKNFVGPNEIVVQPRLEQDTLLKTQIFSPFSEQYTTTKVAELNLHKSLYNSLATHSLGMQLQNMYSGNKLKQQYAPLMDTTSFYNGSHKEYLLDNYTRFTTMEEVLREYIHEVWVSRPDRFKFKMINNDYLIDNQPLLIFDGVPIYNPNVVVAADPLKVKQIDVVAHEFYKGNTTEYGIISFTTYKGDFGGIEINPKALVMDYEGLQLKRDFFSPIYETQQQIASHMPDFRTVLYWSPNTYTDNTGKTIVRFYTSDQTGKYIGVIQGISASGKAGLQTFSFEVK
ncbi:MAG: hypothetical protein EOP47_02850 [Sphingobacteriaceae bacterium]|nr:MAG: hypothetical protein EOP47_02850 [Sphingobacteriaceae bacterium]